MLKKKKAQSDWLSDIDKGLTVNATSKLLRINFSSKWTLVRHSYHSLLKSEKKIVTYFNMTTFKKCRKTLKLRHRLRTMPIITAWTAFKYENEPRATTPKSWTDNSWT